MLNDLIVNPLSGITILLLIGFGVYQVIRMQRLKGQTKPSALAADGDPHDGEHEEKREA